MARWFCLPLMLIASTLTRADSLFVADAWARAPGGGTVAVYATLTNPGTRPAVIRSIASEVAASGDVHETIVDGDMMRMQHLHNFTVAPSATVKLEPGRVHIMLSGQKENLSAGDEFELRLTLEDGATVVFPVTVGEPGQMEAHHGH